MLRLQIKRPGEQLGYERDAAREDQGAEQRDWT
jgi:hypothetical protein